MTDNPLSLQVQAHIDTVVSPELGYAQGELRLLEIDNGIAVLRFAETCASCPATLPSLVARLEVELSQRFPEIEVIEVSL